MGKMTVMSTNVTGMTRQCMKKLSLYNPICSIYARQIGNFHPMLSMSWEINYASGLLY